MRAGVAGLLKVAAPSGPATEIIRPNSTQSLIGTLTGGATAHAVLSDQSDASYVSDVHLSGKGTDEDDIYCQMAMGDLALAAGRAISSVTVTVRHDVTVGSGNVALHYAYMEPSAAVAITNFTVLTSIGNSTATFTKSGGGNWTEAQINAMVLAVAISSNTGTSLTGRVYDVWATVTYA